MASHASAPSTLWALPLPPPNSSTTFTGGAICLPVAGSVGPNGIPCFQVSDFSEVSASEAKSFRWQLSKVESETFAELELACERLQTATMSTHMELTAEREALSAEGSRHRASLAALRGRLVEVERRRAAQTVLVEEKEGNVKSEIAQAQSETEQLLKELVSAKRRASEGSSAFAFEARCASEATAYHEELAAQNRTITMAQQELLEAQRGQISHAVSYGMAGIAGDSRAAHARQRAEHEGRSLRSEIVTVQRQFEAMQAGCEAREFHCELLAHEISALRSDLLTFDQAQKQLLPSGGGVLSVPFANTINFETVSPPTGSTHHIPDQPVECSAWEVAELRVANAQLRHELGATETAASTREAALQLRKDELTAGVFANRAAVSGPPQLTATSFRKPSRLAAAAESAAVSQSSTSLSGRYSPPPSKTTEGLKIVSTPPTQRRGNATPDDPCRTGSPWFSASPDSRLTPFELSVLGTTLDLSTSSASSLPHRYLDHSRSALNTSSKCTACGGCMDTCATSNSSDLTLPASSTSGVVRLKNEAVELLDERRRLQEMLQEVDESLLLQNKKAAATCCSMQQFTEQALQETGSIKDAHAALEATLAKMQEGSASTLSSPSTPLGLRSSCSRLNQLPNDAPQDSQALPAPTLDSLGGSRTPVQGPESLGLFVSQELGNTRRVLEVALGESRSSVADEGSPLRRVEGRPTWINKSNEVVLSSLSGGESDKGDGEKTSMLRGSWSSGRYDAGEMHGELQRRIATLQHELSEARHLHSESAATERLEAEAFQKCRSQLEVEIAMRSDLEARTLIAEGSMWAVPEVERLQKVIAELETKASDEAHRVRQFDHESRERLEQSQARMREEREEMKSYKQLLDNSRAEVADLGKALACERLALTSLRQAEQYQHQKAEQEVQVLREESERCAAESAACERKFRVLADEHAAAVGARRIVDSLCPVEEQSKAVAAQLPIVCACGTTFPAEHSRFCRKCGAKSPEPQDVTKIPPPRLTERTITSMRAARRILDSSSSRSSVGDSATFTDKAIEEHDCRPNEVDLATSIAARLRSGLGASSRSSSEDVGPNVSNIAVGTQDLRSHAADLKRRLASRVCEAAAARRPQSVAVPSVAANSHLFSRRTGNQSLAEVLPEVASAPARRRAASTSATNNISMSSPAALMATARRARLHAKRQKSSEGVSGGALSPPSSPESSLERTVMKSNPLLHRVNWDR